MYPLDQINNTEDYEELVYYYSKLYEYYLKIFPKNNIDADKYAKLTKQIDVFLYMTEDYDSIVKLIEKSFDEKMQQSVKGLSLAEKCEVIHKLLGEFYARHFDSVDARGLLKIQRSDAFEFDKCMNNMTYKQAVYDYRKSIEVSSDPELKKYVYKDLCKSQNEKLDYTAYENLLKQAISINKSTLDEIRQTYIPKLIDNQKKLHSYMYIHLKDDNSLIM